jgi:hypothetical protein
MKKFLIGCGILVLVVGIAGAVGAYYFLWRPAKLAVTEFAKLKEIPQLNQQVRNKTTFSAPADNVLTSEGVDRFLRTQQSIQTKLGQRAEELRAKYQLFGDNLKSDRTRTWSELASAYKDFAGLLVQAKHAQVDSLNENNFSLAEYEWTRRRVYEAAEIPVNLDLEKIIRQIAETKVSGESPTVTTAEASAPVPVKNRSLVAPYKKELTDRAVLAAFGL